MLKDQLCRRQECRRLYLGIFVGIYGLDRQMHQMRRIRLRQRRFGRAGSGVSDNKPDGDELREEQGEPEHGDGGYSAVRP